MKRTLKVFVALAVSSTAMVTTSCEKFLDVNTNPNNILQATPEAVLPNALKTTGDNFGNLYNTYGNWVAGYWGKSGIVNGFAEERTYNYTGLYQQALWTNTYDNIKDYDLVEQGGVTQGRPNITAIGTIMKVYNYQLLVDEYGDIPYSQALKGVDNIIPAYDKADVIYKDLATKLDGAIAAIAATPTTTRAVGSEDVVFGGSMTNWTKFAQTLKLRILLRQSNVNKSYVQAEIAKMPTTNAAYLSTDAQVQPGFIQSTGQQSPFFDRYGLTSTGGSTTERNYTQPTQFIINQYQDNKDPRLNRLYTAAADPTVVGQYRGVFLGDPSVKGVNLYSRLRLNGGLLKGYDASVPLILAAESYFLQSEAKVLGFMAGGATAAKADYLAGIKASFTYFYTPSATQRGGVNDLSANITKDYDAYIAANVANPKINWDLATSPEDNAHQIYFQKYLAFNTVESIEAWSEYRRTGYPKVENVKLPNGQLDGTKTFTSISGSTSPRADMLPVRLLYPQSEIATNLANVPTGISQFTSKIFWDVVD